MVMMQRHLDDPPVLKKVTAERVCPVVEAFFKGLQPEQWRALKSGKVGNPDFDTEYMLAEFIVKLIGIMSQHILNIVQGGSVAVSEAGVFFEMSKALPQTSALDIDADLARMTLAKLIAKEVMLNVQSELSSSSSSSSTSEGLCIRAVPPKRLSHMIILGLRMIKGYICNMDCLCGCRLQSQESDRSDVEIAEEQDKKLEETHVDEDKKDVIASQGSLNTATLKTVQYVIEKAATEPAMPNLAQGGQKCVPPSDTLKEKHLQSIQLEDSAPTEPKKKHGAIVGFLSMLDNVITKPIRWP